MPGPGYANKAAGDGDFRNKNSKGGAGTDMKGPHGHKNKNTRLGAPTGTGHNPGSHSTGGKGKMAKY